MEKKTEAVNADLIKNSKREDGLGETDRQTDRQTVRQAGRQAGRQAARQR